MPWGTGERKEETRERGNPGFTGDGSEGDRGGEAQTGPGLVILRYHVLRITVSVTCARARVRAMCVYVHTDVTILLSRYSSVSLSFSLFLLFLLFSLSFVSSLSLAPSFLSFRTISLSLSIHPLPRQARSSSFCLEELETLSRAHTLEADRLQRVLKYRHTRGTLHGARCIRWRTLKTPERSVLE